jgi:hypothetical protein
VGVCGLWSAAHKVTQLKDINGTKSHIDARMGDSWLNTGAGVYSGTTPLGSTLSDQQFARATVGDLSRRVRAEGAKRAEKTREEAAAENRPGDAGRRPASGGSQDPENKQHLMLPLFVFGILWPSCSREARVAGTLLSSLLGDLCVSA